MPFFQSDDHRLFYRETGNGSPLVILPGNTASSAHHQAELAHFGTHYRTAALDFLGTGQSDRRAIWPDTWWEQGARDAAALIAHLAAESAVIVGTSGGGTIALLTAALFPNQVRAVIADSCAVHVPPERLRAEVAARDPRDPGAAAFWQHGHGPDWEQVVDADSALLLRLADRGGGFIEVPFEWIRCPVLLTGSREDRSLSGLSEQFSEMARRIPDCRTFLTDTGDHPLMWSRPESFRQAANDFLNSLSR